MPRCLVLGCPDRSDKAKDDYVCRWHWRNAPARYTKTIKMFEKSGRNPHLLNRLWGRFLIDAIARDAGLGPITVQENNRPWDHIP